MFSLLKKKTKPFEQPLYFSKSSVVTGQLATCTAVTAGTFSYAYWPDLLTVPVS